ncbi:hypothetical protein FS837_006257 [Tulasnella sp. UAMH 9824]|nr:hypothetical protein FS837_006257 [Tulasnella sp. UAMH 9824]
MVGGKRGLGARGEVSTTENVNVPRSFIVKQGHVGASLTQLVRDMRKVMEPNTAARLKERSTNKLKDFLVMAPLLKVSHLLAFSLAKTAPTLRIARLPQGPTFSFRIERYSLAKDVLNASRHPKQSPQAFQYPPLLVLSSFPTGPNAPQHLSLVLKCFQSLFPPLTPKTIPLSTARRVVLVSWNAENQTIDIRHYLITVKTSGVTRRVRRILEPKAGSGGKIPDLSREKDIADYVLKAAGGEDGYETASTSAASDADPEEYAVKLASDYVGRNNRKGDKRAVKLDEIGPRMELRLVKIVEGPPGKEGGVLFHEFVKKSPKEVAALRKEAAERARLRKQRREEQERNIARKQNAAEGNDDEDEGTDTGEARVDEDEDDENWNADEDVSEGEEQDQAMSEDDVSESEEETEKAAPPRKRVKTGNATKPKGAIRLRK